MAVSATIKMMMRYLGKKFMRKLFLFLLVSAFCPRAFAFYPNAHDDLESYHRFLGARYSELQETKVPVFCAELLSQKIYTPRQVSLPPRFFKEKQREIGVKIVAQIHDLQSLIRRKTLRSSSLHEVGFKECAPRLGSLLKTLRYIDEFISVWAHGIQSIPIESLVPFQEMDILTGAKNANISRADTKFNLWRSLQTGDIILAKFNTPVSSYASNGTGDEFDLSHVLVSIADPINFEHKILETSIHHGLTQYPVYPGLQSAVRIQIYRTDLPPKTTQELVKNFLSQVSGKKLLYDFEMDDVSEKKEKKLFCSELLVSIYKDHLPFPYTRSFFRSTASPLIQATSIPFESIFQPALIEADPRLNLVSEWRYLPKVLDSHFHDAIASALFDWENDFGYRIRENSLHHQVLNTLWYLDKVPFFSKLLQRVIPQESPRSVVLSYGTTQKIITELMSPLREADRRHKTSFGVHMALDEVHRTLNHLRLEDLERFKGNKPTVFHHLFSPIAH
jgi:hypothetical protein